MKELTHPLDKYLRQERLPHIWCPGCGIGTTLGCFLKALDESGLNPDKVVMVSGIGCTGRAPGYVNLDSFHTTHGRAIPFATGMKLANPELTLVVLSGDGDLFAIGGNHIIHAAARNVDLKVICVTNFNYGMTGGQVAPTTPLNSVTTTTPYGNTIYPLNLVWLMASAGAVYVARWTIVHVHLLIRSIKEILQKPGFCFIEVISPCPTCFGRRNKFPRGVDMLNYLRKNSEIKPNADLHETGIDLREDSKIIIGKFVDIERPQFNPMAELPEE